MTRDTRHGLHTGGTLGRQSLNDGVTPDNRESDAATGGFLAECWELADPLRSGRQKDDGATIADDDPRGPDDPATSQTHWDDKSASRGLQLPISQATSRDSPECTQGAVGVSSELPTAAAMRIVDDADDWTVDDRREAYEERAAIMEFDGQLPRHVAEAKARRIAGWTG